MPHRAVHGPFPAHGPPSGREGVREPGRARVDARQVERAGEEILEAFRADDGQALRPAGVRFGKHGAVHPRRVRQIRPADHVHLVRRRAAREPSGGRRPGAARLVPAEGPVAEVLLPGGRPVRAGEQLRDHDPRVHGEQLEEGLRAGDERERQVPRGVEGEDALRPGPAHQVRGHGVRQGASDEDPRGSVRVLPWPRGGRHEPEPAGGVGVHGSEPAVGCGLQPRGRAGRRVVLV